MSDQGNGADPGQMLAILHELAAGQKDIRSTLGDHGRKLEDLRAVVVLDHSRTLAEHGRRLDDLAAGVAGLRQSVTEYHASVLGHGVLFSQLEERVRRIERRLDMPPAAA